MAFTPAIPLTQPTYNKMLFDGTAVAAADIVGAIDSALNGGLLVRVSIEAFKEGESLPQWRIRAQRPGDIDEIVAVGGMWIVVSSTGKIRFLTDEEYHAEFASE